jgi:hypothetical protein
MKQLAGIIGAVCLFLMLGCASHSPWRECEAHLVPINKPAPASASGSQP